MSEFRDYIIVGQGIAGSILAVKLLQRGRSVLVYDEPERNISSSVAAGIYNPITGRRLVKTWLADKLWPSLNSFYPELEKITGKRFYFPMDHYRPFRTAADTNDMLGRSDAPGYDKYIKNIFTQSEFGNLVQDPYGGISIRESGYVDLSLIMASVRTYLAERESIHEEYFDFNKIDSYDPLIFDGIKAGKLIFCNGWRDQDLPVFKDLPFSPVKGEILKIKTENPIEQIFNQGVFILPKSGNLSIVGSTYEHDLEGGLITQKGKTQLVEKLDELLNIPYEIIDHSAGIRPTTRDRRPFVGIHPKFETIGILNGLGTKGVSLAPHFADELISFIEGSGEIDREADVKRYY